MWRYKLIGIVISLKSFCFNLFNDPSDYGFQPANDISQIRRSGHLDKNLKESSGLSFTSNGEIFTHQDSGGASALFQISPKGETIDTSLFNLPNKDWEELATINEDQILIGDIGNNANKRRDLKIYRVNPRSSKIIDTLAYSYGDQSNFPPAPEKMNFDCEAFFTYQNSIYLISKNRGSNWVKVYQLPHKSEGEIELYPIDSTYIPQQVTAADIDSETGRFMILTYGMIYTFTWGENSFFENPEYAIRFNRGGQNEAIAKDPFDKSWLISNEVGKLFRLRFKD